jgi:pSer/pThr/pTyr-binding forkhead associated (FHA) protein
MLVDLGSMCGTYIKVSNFEQIVLEPGMVFLVGSDINIEFDKVVNDHNASDFGPELTLEDGGCMSMNMVQDSDPFVIIKVSKASADNEATVQTSTWKFVAQDPNKVFTIGRSQVCDINLPENTISRTQCRVFYSNRSWKLLDGVENKPTVNGTWQSISRRNTAIRQESDPFPLKNGSRIKLDKSEMQLVRLWFEVIKFEF